MTFDSRQTPALPFSPIRLHPLVRVSSPIRVLRYNLLEMTFLRRLLISRQLLRLISWQLPWALRIPLAWCSLQVTPL